MFEFIKGNLAFKGLDYIVLNVGGIGYKIYVSHRTNSVLGETNNQVTVYTYLNVKENELTLYGFVNREELSVFEMLISVSGVGPKVAISILATLSSAELSMAVVTGDFKTITKSKGVGPKLAQRIILELKDKIKKNMNVDISEDTFLTDQSTDNNVQKDAVSALMVLGYNSKEASNTVKKVYEEGLSLEEVVKLALRNMI